MPNEKPEIIFKNLKIQERLSEETLCFSAVVSVNGVEVIDARNHGHGAPTFLNVLYTDEERSDPDKALAKAQQYNRAMDALERYCKSLPERPVPGLDPAMGGVKYRPQLLIDVLVARKLEERRLSRLLKTHVVFTREAEPVPGGCKLGQYPIKDIPREKAISLARGRMGEPITILNELPLERALTLFAGPAPGEEAAGEEGEDSPSP